MLCHIMMVIAFPFIDVSMFFFIMLSVNQNFTTVYDNDLYYMPVDLHLISIHRQHHQMSGVI